MTETSSPWLKLPQGAEYIQMTPQHFRELVYAGKIPSYQRSERNVFVHTADLDAYMRSLPSAAKVPEVLRRTA